MADRDARGAGRDEDERRPTEAEAWAEFWDRLTAIYVSLPAETQRRLAEGGADGSDMR